MPGQRCSRWGAGDFSRPCFFLRTGQFRQYRPGCGMNASDFLTGEKLKGGSKRPSQDLAQRAIESGQAGRHQLKLDFYQAGE